MLRIIFAFLSVPLFGYAQNWQSVGNFNNASTALYVDSADNLLYAGGHFTNINSEDRWGIASWNSNNWDSLGLGIDYDSISNSPGPLWAFLRDGNYLYTVGAMQRAGTVNTNGIARWDGANWDSVPGCIIPDYKVVNDIVKYNGDIYVCGSFDSVGSLPTHGLAKWNGTTWQSVANNYGFTLSSTGRLTKMCFYHGRLFVAGMFEDPSGNICRLANWDGLNWHFMTNDIQGSIASINDMVVFQDRLYVGGLFFQSAGNVANSLQTWNDTVWNAVGGSVQILSNSYPTIHDMTIHNGKLYCVGNFEKIGGVPAHSLAAWDGTNWCSFGTYFDNRILQIAFYNDTMYISGGFWTINGDSISYMAKWIGGNYVDTCGYLTTGFYEPVEGETVSLYPNPSNHFVTFKFSNESSNHTLVITDHLGRTIWRRQSSESTIEFPAYQFAEGIYFYSVQSETGSASGKFIIQR